MKNFSPYHPSREPETLPPVETTAGTPALRINDRVAIPPSELSFRFARSGGKGGQNVNKVETKVELLFDVAQSPSLSEEQRAALRAYPGANIDTGGILHIVAQESRSQWKNREAAVARFIETVRSALKPRKKRKPTKVSYAAKQKRLDSKKRRGEIKKMRGKEW